MRIVTFDDKFHVLTNPGEHDTFVLLFPVHESLASGWIIGRYANETFAQQVVKTFVNQYAQWVTQGYRLQHANRSLMMFPPDCANGEVISFESMFPSRDHPAPFMNKEISFNAT